MNKMIILDNGHGAETPGKRSPVWPDGSQLFEYEFNRDIVRRIAAMLTKLGLPFTVLVTEGNDVSLTERVRRANNIAENYKDAILISVHGNAGGGTGWEAFTSPGQTKSDKIAEALYNQAKIHLPDFPVRKDTTDRDQDKEAKFTILTKTICPAVLTENLFMDTLKDCQFMQSDKGRNTIALLHVKALIDVV